MKVLLTSDWYTPAVNGVVTSLLNLRHGLEADGHEVRILTLSQSPHSFSSDGVTYIGSIPAGVVYPGARLRTASGRKAVQEIIAWRPDIVHSNCEFSTFRIARRISERLNIPLIHTYHTVYENYTHYFSPVKKWGKAAARSFSRHIAARCDCIIAPTGKVKKLLDGYKIAKPIYVVPSGIETEHFSQEVTDAERMQLRKQLGIPENHTVLVSVGRLAKEKNCEELLRSVCNFRNAPLTLLLVGDGPYRSELKHISREIGIDNQVIFTGMVPPENVWRYYQAGDLFVSASTSETQGLTYLEALSSGLPLLCRKDECLTGVLKNGINGWQYENTTELCDRITLFLHCPELRNKFQHNALELSRNFSVSAFAENTEQIYTDRLLSGAIPKKQVILSSV